VAEARVAGGSNGSIEGCSGPRLDTKATIYVRNVSSLPRGALSGLGQRSGRRPDDVAVDEEGVAWVVNTGDNTLSRLEP
jgi:hypothetical protein